MYTDVITEIARFKAGRIHVARAGLATQARLCVDMLQQGRGMAWVVKNRDELLTARALMRLFSPCCGPKTSGLRFKRVSSRSARSGTVIAQSHGADQP